MPRPPRRSPNPSAALAVAAALPALALLATLAACGRGGTGESAAAAPAADPASGPLFVDATAETGLDFVHFNGMTGEYYFPEIAGSGAALFDYDGDGDLDLYLVQGSLLGGAKMDQAIRPRVGPPGGRLYRNDLTVGTDGGRNRRTVRFVDVTAESGIVALGDGMGVAAGDYDNDGHVDLYLTNYGHNQLWRNRGDGTFVDATAAAGVDDPRWSVSASWVDYDADGWLDLFIANYVDFTIADNLVCRSAAGWRDYCGPKSFDPVPDRLFHNDGDGTFTDVTGRSGISSAYGSGLGVATADFDGDGRLDLYVANDQDPNILWHNSGDGRFSNDALLAGCAVNGDGLAESSMGIDAADVDGDGDEDLFMTNLTLETNTLYLNRGDGTFDDASLRSGLGQPSYPFTSFATAFLDVDRDGRPDLPVFSGAVRIEEGSDPTAPFPFDQTAQLFLNLGGGRFTDATARGGPAFAASTVARGAAFGDLDDDGDTDIVVSANSGPARLLLDVAADGRPWLGLRLVGGSPGRDMLGARAALYLAGGTVFWRRARSDGSYASANDPRILFGLAGAAAEPVVERIVVVWPDGRREQWPGPPLGRYTTLRQGEGRPAAAP